MSGYRDIFRRLWPIFKKEKKLFIAVNVVVLLTAGLSRAQPQLIGYAIDHGFKSQNHTLTQKIAAVYVLVTLMYLFFMFVQNYIFKLLGNKVVQSLHIHLLEHVQRLPLSYFNRVPAGAIITRATNDVGTISELFSEGIVDVFTQSAVILSILIAMSLISLKLTFWTLITTPVFIYFAYKLTQKIKAELHEVKKRLSNLNVFLAESLNGIKIIQIYNRVLRSQEKFKKLSDEYRAQNVRSIRTYAYLPPLMNLLTAAVLSSALYLSGWIGREDQFAIGSVVAFILHALDFVPPLRQILEKFQQFQNGITSGERLFQLLAEEEEQQGSLRRKGALRGQIQIHNLNFRYSSDLPLVLKNINLNISPGESVALVGRTGSGKSTLISLLQRFYRPPDGTVFVDETPIELFSTEYLRSQIGLVQQDPFLFKGTIRSNIQLVQKGVEYDQDLFIAADDKVKAAADKVGLVELLKKTGRDLDSVVEEKGANLSMGERQLIAFARILAFEPSVLILDEATANIDSETELMIQRATKEVMKNRTSILVAHRLSTLKDCQRLIHLENGEISSPS